ncbi:MAG TPA: glycosyltransferase [Polyangiaceae bacterium]|nr:glycosyltransferase [Polyangiaceae bacterium]
MTAVDPATSRAREPRLSIVVVVHRMARQAENTLYTLSPSHQRNVRASDYEVVVVENASADELGAERATGTGPNVRYFRREETGTSPAPALNFGVREARGAQIGLCIDGARMVTPRVVEYALLAARMDENALVVVPGYHLGDEEQSRAAGYGEEQEKALLERCRYREDGYGLFDVAVLSSANRHGFFHPFMESNCLFCPKTAYLEIGGADERFDLPGGGSVNLYLYRRLALRPESRLVVLPGEGSFHQFHGGITTTPAPDLDQVLAEHRAQLASILGAPFEAPKREPMLLGAVTSHAQRMLRHSVDRADARFSRFRAQGDRAWSDDPDPTE